MGPPSSKAKVLAPAPVSRSTRNVGSSKDAHSEMVADQNQDQNEDQDQDQDPATKAGRLYDFVDRIVNAVSCTCRDVLGMPKMGAKSVGRERSANDDLNIFVHVQRPCLFVSVVAIVVGVVEKEKKNVYLVDDGTAVVQVYQPMKRTQRTGTRPATSRKAEVGVDQDPPLDKGKGKAIEPPVTRTGIPDCYIRPPSPVRKSAKTASKPAAKSKNEMAETVREKAWEVGTLLKVTGRLRVEWSGERAVHAEEIVPLDDPNQEPLHRLAAIEAAQTIYAARFVLPASSPTRFTKHVGMRKSPNRSYRRRLRTPSTSPTRQDHVPVIARKDGNRTRRRPNWASGSSDLDLDPAEGEAEPRSKTLMGTFPRSEKFAASRHKLDERQRARYAAIARARLESQSEEEEEEGKRERGYGLPQNSFRGRSAKNGISASRAKEGATAAERKSKLNPSAKRKSQINLVSDSDTERENGSLQKGSAAVAATRSRAFAASRAKTGSAISRAAINLLSDSEDERKDEMVPRPSRSGAADSVHGRVVAQFHSDSDDAPAYGRLLHRHQNGKAAAKPNAPARASLSTSALHRPRLESSDTDRTPTAKRTTVVMDLRSSSPTGPSHVAPYAVHRSGQSASYQSQPTTRQLRHWSKLPDSKITEALFRLYVQKHIIEHCARSQLLATSQNVNVSSGQSYIGGAARSDERNARLPAGAVTDGKGLPARSQSRSSQLLKRALPPSACLGESDTEEERSPRQRARFGPSRGQYEISQAARRLASHSPPERGTTISGSATALGKAATCRPQTIELLDSDVESIDGPAHSPDELPPAFTLRYLMRVTDLRRLAAKVVQLMLAKRDRESGELLSLAKASSRHASGGARYGDRKPAVGPSTGNRGRFALSPKLLAINSAGRSRPSSSPTAQMKASGLRPGRSSLESVEDKVLRLFQFTLRQMLADGYIVVASTEAELRPPFDGKKRRKREGHKHRDRRSISTSRPTLGTAGKTASAGWGSTAKDLFLDLGGADDGFDAQRLPSSGSWAATDAQGFTRTSHSSPQPGTAIVSLEPDPTLDPSSSSDSNSNSDDSSDSECGARASPTASRSGGKFANRRSRRSSQREEAYQLVNVALLRPALLDLLRSRPRYTVDGRKEEGLDTARLTNSLQRADERWRNVASDLVEETLEEMRTRWGEVFKRARLWNLVGRVPHGI